MARLGRSFPRNFLQRLPKPVTFSNSGSFNNSNVAWSSGSISATCGGGDRLLVVGVSMRNVTDFVTSMTYNGVAMLPSKTGVIGSDAIELWYLVNPTAGTNTLTVNRNILTSAVFGYASFQNVDQANPLGTAVSNTGTSTTASVDVTASLPGEMIIDIMGYGAILGLPSAQSGTSRWTDACVPGMIISRSVGAAQTMPGASGTVTDTYTIPSSVNWAIIANNIHPIGYTQPATPSAVQNLLTLLGVGI